MTTQGYIDIKIPSHPMAKKNGYLFEHRLVAERMLGRPLEPNEVVHHKNGVRSDNRPENLEITTSQAEHLVRHRSGKTPLRRPGEENPFICCACGCGEARRKFDYKGREHRYINGHQARYLARDRWTKARAAVSAQEEA